MNAPLSMHERAMMASHLAPVPVALGAVSERLDRQPTIIETLWNPWTCPVDLLPWLAETLSVDFWDASWPEMRKRAIIASQINLERKKGTLHAIRGYADMAGARIRQVTRPPQRVFSGPSQTRAEREAWLSSLPQVRVFLPRVSRSQPYQLRAGGALRPSFFETAYPVPCVPRRREAIYRLADGSESAARVEENGSSYRLHFPSVRGYAVFSNAVFAKQFFVPGTASTRVFTVAPQSRLAGRGPIGPGLRAITAEPERIAENAPRNPYQVLDGDLLNRQFFVPSTAAERLYDRWAVLLPGAAYNRARLRLACQFMGTGYYGWPSHTLRLSVDMKSRNIRFRAGFGPIIPHSRFWVPVDAKPLRLLRRALGHAKSGRDTIHLQFSPSTTLTVGKPLIMGTSLITGRPLAS